MQISLELLVVFFLSLIFVEDLLWRMVRVYWFCGLFAGCLLLAFNARQSAVAMLLNGLENSLIVLFITGSTWLLISMRNKIKIKELERIMGYGDLVFLLVTGFYLSVLNFVFFNVLSLLSIALIWPLYARIIKSDRIPMAGLQALALIFLMAADRFWLRLDLTSNYWIWKKLLLWA